MADVFGKCGAGVLDTLITFIGKGRLKVRKDSTPLSFEAFRQNLGSDETGYARTVYGMDLDGKRIVTGRTAFLGLALEKLLHPRKLVILGTAGSSWIELLNHFGKEKIPDYEELYDYFARLSWNGEYAPGSAPDEQILLSNIRRLQDSINSVLKGCATVIRIIPADFSHDSQAAFYRTVFETVSPGETVAVDITHGFRGVPVICLSAAYYLVFVKRVVLRSIYYGFFENPDRRDDITEVTELSGIRELMDWTFAFAKFEKSQDLSCFSSPLVKENAGNAEAADIADMNSFSFYERITCPYLSGDSPVPDYLEKGSPITALLRDTFMEKTRWATDAGLSWPERLKLISENYYDSGDYLRCMIYAHEAAMTHYYYDLSEQKTDIRNKSLRDYLLKRREYLDNIEHQAAVYSAEIVKNGKKLNPHEWLSLKLMQKFLQNSEEQEKLFLKKTGFRDMDSLSEQDLGFCETKQGKTVYPAQKFLRDEKREMAEMYDKIAKKYYGYYLGSSWKDFNNLRNIMAHGSVDDDAFRNKYLCSEKVFRKELRKLLDRILKDIVPRTAP